MSLVSVYIVYSLLDNAYLVIADASMRRNQHEAPLTPPLTPCWHATMSVA